MLKMNYWTDKWDLDVSVCPCDSHFNDWIAKNKIKNKLIYHFGTGTHHLVGIKQAVNKSGNAVFAITASKEEHDAYVALAIESPRIARSYLVYFGDIYLSDPRLLPDLDLVTMFHLCEFSQPGTVSEEYGGLTDRALLDLFTAKVAAGGCILFYKGSKDFDKAAPIIAAWQSQQRVERVEEFKTLLIYRRSA